MRTRHTQHALPAFPVFSAAFVNDTRLVLGGGGGSSRSGIKNRLRVYDIPDNERLALVTELELEKDEDAPMSMVADITGSRIICGINSATDQLDKGVNNNCRVFNLEEDEFRLDGVASTLQVSSKNLEECQRVTAISPGKTLIAAAGSRDLAILSYPSLNPAANSLRTEYEIYDVAFSLTTILVATTNKVLVYALPAASAPDGSFTSSRIRSKKQKQKQKAKSEQVGDLELLSTIEPPALAGLGAGSSSFRAVRFHPTNHNIVYTVLNTVSPRTRTRVSKTPSKQGYVCRWNAETWEVMKSRKVGEKGITCFDISENGKFLAYGSADYTVGILDATTLAPLLSVLKAHDFPPTVLRFNPSSNLLVSCSADNTIRAVAVPEGLAGTTWTTGSVLRVTLLILLLSVVISYVYSSGLLNQYIG
ncbi:hypothetical protein EW145_g6157 [Phellinidium pouzarii]|uniref:Uncharacterized protein n=1 Tax=Phellinidium pouzarii TaxID=167371 RepID=A0A4V3XBX1_9AGAM|nr:hypothetical protein EW145_g6157 [Phellinidium pouzarii]